MLQTVTVDQNWHKHALCSGSWANAESRWWHRCRLPAVSWHSILTLCRKVDHCLCFWRSAFLLTRPLCRAGVCISRELVQMQGGTLDHNDAVLIGSHGERQSTGCCSSMSVHVTPSSQRLSCRHRVRRRTGISPRAASEFLTLHHAQAAADVSVALRDQLAALPLPLQQIVQLTHADAQKHLAHSSSTAAALAEQLQQVCNHLSCHQPQLLADLADATSSAAAAPQAVATSAGQSAQKAQDWLTPIADGLDYILQSIKSGLDKFDVPYSYGWSIIGLTIFTKVLTFPFTKAQV